MAGEILMYRDVMQNMCNVNRPDDSGVCKVEVYGRPGPEDIGRAEDGVGAATLEAP